MLDEQARLDAKVLEVYEAVGVNMKAIDLLAVIAERLVHKDAVLDEWKMWAEQQVSFLLRAQEQTDKRLDALTRMQDETRERVEEIKAQLASRADKSQD